MPWLRKTKHVIPPIQSDETRRQSPGGFKGTSPIPPSNFSRSSSATYVPSRDGVYDQDKARAELFAGYDQTARSGRFTDRNASGTSERRRTPPPGEENDEDVEGIKQEMRYLKQDSVNSTRNALRLAREAEETARNTVNKLGSQSEKLADTERHLDVSKGYSQSARDKTEELKQLNRSIFIPTWTRNKDAKRAAQEHKVRDRYEEERQEREQGMRDVRETQDRLGRAATFHTEGEGIGGEGSGRFRTAAQLHARKDQRKRYQFEADEEDDQLEDEIDDNLDEIMDVTKRLKVLGTAMSSELDTQNIRIDRITEKTDDVDAHLFDNTQRLNRIK